MTFELILIYFFHWVGDFVLQTKYISENKNKSFLALFFHVCLYTATIGLPLLLIAPFIHEHYYIAWILLNGGFHFMGEAIMSKMYSKYQDEGKTKAAFNAMGFEQFIHTCFLTLTTAWFI